MSDDAPTLNDARPIADRAPLATTILARYEVGALLGEGGMGEVRECHDRVTERPVAVKLIRRDREARQLEARFVREACVQAQLEHPSVVPVYDVGRDDAGAAFFTMRKVSGITLDQVLERTRKGEAGIGDAFSRHRLLTAFAQICLTVEYAHTRGVLHRDLKPANVMFGDFGQIYVLDWGLAKITALPDEAAPGAIPVAADALQTIAGSTMGTPAYMAPEQLAGGVLDARADVFALGAILFELLTHETLLDDDAIRARLRHKPSSWDARPSVRAPHRQIPPEFDRICVRATTENVERRYPTARALHDAIERYLGGERDLELRRTRGAALLVHATELARTDRDRAFKDVVRALALAPDDPRALPLLVDLMRSSPDASAKARLHVESQAIGRLRRGQRLGAALFTTPWLTIYPLLLWLRGARTPYLAAIPPIAWIASGIAMLVDNRKQTDKVVYPTVAVMVAVAVTAVVFGPFVMVPTLATTVIANHVLVSPRPIRRLQITLGVLAVAVPSILAWIGVLDVYRFESETTIVLQGVFHAVKSQNLEIALTVLDVLILLGTAFFAIQFRDEIERARTDSALFTWQLSKLLPPLVPTKGAPALVVLSDPDTGRDLLDTEIDAPSRTVVSLPTSTPTGDDGPLPLTLDGPRYVESSPIANGIRVARDVLVGRDVAMKRPDATRDDARFRREALLQARIDHPAVPSIYELGVDASGPFFTMRLVAGTSLATGRDRPRHRILSALAQVCLTVDYAHAQGVIHAALRPSSIVLGDFGEVYVLDWSHAKASLAPDDDGPAPAGSYIAPEQAASRVDPRTDVFAIGAILFEVLTGHPLGGDRVATVLGSYDARPSRHAADIPSELDEICVKATAYDPDARFPTARALHDAIDAFLGSDRDMILRRSLAARHLETGSKSAELAIANGDIAARSDALREIGRALALAPDRGPALRLLEHLLAVPPPALPHDVAREIAAQSWAMSRRAAPSAALVYLIAWLAGMPLIAVIAGIREPIAVAVIAIAWSIAAAALYAQYAWTREPPRLPWASLAGMLAVGTTSLLFGPYILGPAAAIAMTMGYLLGGSVVWRRAILTLGCAAVIIPGVLGWFHVLDAFSIAETPTAVTFVVEGALHHSRNVVFALVTGGNVAIILVASAYAARFRDVLEEIEADNRAKVIALARLVE